MKQIIIKVSKVVARLRNSLCIFVDSVGECFISFGEEIGGFIAFALVCIFLLPIGGIIVLLNLFYNLLEDVYKKLKEESK